MAIGARRAWAALPSAGARRAYAAAEDGLSREAVTERVLGVVRAFEKVEPDAVKEDSHFANDLGLDSLDTVELGLALEDEFAIEIPDEDAEAIVSVADAVNYIAGHPSAH